MKCWSLALQGLIRTFYQNHSQLGIPEIGEESVSEILRCRFREVSLTGFMRCIYDAARIPELECGVQCPVSGVTQISGNSLKILSSILFGKRN